MSEETTPKQGSGLAIAGLVLGIIAAVTSFLPIINNLSAILAFIGFVLALIALIGALKGKHTAKGISIAGVVLCVVSFVIVLATQSAFKAALDKTTSGSQPVASSATSKQDAKKEEAASTKEQDAKKEEQSSEQKSEEKDYTKLAVGETVTLDSGLSVTVNSVDTSLKNYDDSAIVGVNVTYANNGSENESFNLYDWKGEDANGAQRMTTYYSEGADALNSGTLSAGGTVTGNIYFEGGTVRVLFYSNMFNNSATAAWNI